MNSRLAADLKLLKDAKDAYYNGTPILTDAVYDDLEDRVKSEGSLLPAGDPLKLDIEAFMATVGAPIASATGAWDVVKHKAPMGSLNKAQTQEDMQDWGTTCTKMLDAEGISSTASYLLSEKLDGISLGLYYSNGTLSQAITRGDGIEGQDITRNVLKMQGVVKYIKGFTGFLRGEIVLKRSVWEKHFKDYKNPRNAASGMSTDFAGTNCSFLTVIHYQMIRFDGAPIPNKVAEFKILQALGAEVPNWQVVSDLGGVQRIYQEYVNTKRDALDYDIDGLVIEYSDPKQFGTLGSKNDRPRGAIAYKFPHDRKLSRLQDIKWQVGNSGRITPVAYFEPVDLAGATVAQASLHNLRNIRELLVDLPKAKGTLYVGDTIVVSRRNDVIPYAEEVLASEADNGAKPLPPPTLCPVCGTALKMDGEYLVCPNTDECPAQTSGAIKAWVGKIGLKGWGGAIIDSLCDQGIINDAADLYLLDAKTLSDVQMDGRRIGSTANTILAELHSKKVLPLHIIMGSLNIPMCSRSTMKAIVDAGYDSVDKMMAATLAEIASIPGMGIVRAENFHRGIRTKLDLINRLFQGGVQIQVSSNTTMKGKSVCFTGIRDPVMERAIEDAGGTVKGSVSKNLTYLVADDPNSTSGKAKKARDCGVPILTVAQMWKELGK